MRALVTGGSAGLGKALCDTLLADGYHVLSIDREAPKTASAAKHTPCDLSKREAVDALLETLKVGDAFDLVIFNAGISATGKFEEIEPEAHARVVEVNAVAPISLCAGLLKAGKISKGGRIGFISSLSHFTGYPGAASYGASKDAVAVYANSIRKALRKKQISVTAIFPGPLKTEHAERHAPEGADAEKRMTPEQAAQLILSDVQKGKAKSLPGGGAKLFAVLGRIAPKPITWAMKKIIYNKLDKTVSD